MSGNKWDISRTLNAQFSVLSPQSQLFTDRYSFVQSKQWQYKSIDTYTPNECEFENVNANDELLFIEITVLLVVTVLINYLNVYDAMNTHRYVYGKWHMTYAARHTIAIAIATMACKHLFQHNRMDK